MNIYIYMKTKLSRTEINGFPVCREYRYLGLRLTNKLSMTNQLAYIKNKSEDIHRRLSPFLHKADADTRKNLWQTFIQPLIEFILPLYKLERAKTNILKANSVIRGSFKLFMGLCKSTSNEIVDLLSGYNFTWRANLIYEIAQRKWVSRKNGEVFNYQRLPLEIQASLNRQKMNVCQCMPHELIEFLNITKSKCLLCDKLNSIQHLRFEHNCAVPTLEELLQSTANIQKCSKPRKEKLDAIRRIIQFYLSQVRNCILKQKTTLFHSVLF